MTREACVYFLFSLKDKRTYVGSTPILDIHLTQHHNGQVVATRNRRPLKLIYQERHPSLADARRQEKYYKTAAGRRAMKKILQELLPTKK